MSWCAHEVTSSVCLENGYITTDQLREILWELDPTISVPDMDNIIEEIDADGSGTVDFDGESWDRRFWRNSISDHRCKILQKKN